MPRSSEKFQEETFTAPLPGTPGLGGTYALKVPPKAPPTVAPTTAPSQLIGQRLTIHLYHDRLVGFCRGTVQVVELPHSCNSIIVICDALTAVSYRHVIDSLRLKPRELFRSGSRTCCQTTMPPAGHCMLTRLDAYNACRLDGRLPYIAANKIKSRR